ncbi:sufA Fe-S cluster assembly scaffold protein [uncultured Caudovirales phage]|uniref:SufA Fe-S cluster assembly scaffold protein n=1 Tax=uncultured Caudovirales phage TaxID=2100421 RepID=A0A6J5LJR7_9CAUD|nr:sufA Fe-S cluster assembly scaffold protein [uncultured Caudovirales phage]
MEDNQLERYQYPMGQITMINLNESAIEKLKELIAEEDNPALKLRVFVQGGGCSGFQYGFTFDDEKTEDDFDLEFDGVQVLVDSMSAQYLQGATIKYTSDAMGSNFSIDNPQATTTCGCGSSFSV